jgi:hypothetical protein
MESLLLWSLRVLLLSLLREHMLWDGQDAFPPDAAVVAMPAL